MIKPDTRMEIKGYLEILNPFTRLFFPMGYYS
jgi:hypothetical protein